MSLSSIRTKGPTLCPNVRLQEDAPESVEKLCQRANWPLCTNRNHHTHKKCHVALEGAFQQIQEHMETGIVFDYWSNYTDSGQVMQGSFCFHIYVCRARVPTN